MRLSSAMKNIILVGGNVVENRGRILLIRRISVFGSGWKLPSGASYFGEDIIECAARHGFLETGYLMNPEYLIGIYQCYFDRARNIILFGFKSNVSGGDLRPIKGKIDIGWFRLSEINELYKKGELKTPCILNIILDYKQGRQISLTAIKILD